MTIIRVVLIVLLGLHIIQAVAKFAVHFTVPYEKRIAKIRTYYDQDARVIRRADTIILTVAVALVVLLVLSGEGEVVSFATGLIVGMTLLQVYFHRFLEELPPDEAPDPPLSPVKTMSFAIHANPAKAWLEYLLMTVLLLGSLVLIILQL